MVDVTINDPAFVDIEVNDVRFEGGSGTKYVSRKGAMSKGVLFIHGLGSNRYSFNFLARDFALRGFFCLSIDLPSHFTDTREFSLSAASQSAIYALKYMMSLGITRIAVIGHSLGGTVALFTSVGYNEEIEKIIFNSWNNLLNLIENFDRTFRALNDSQKTEAMLVIERELKDLQTKINNSLQLNAELLNSVNCYVLLSTPDSFPMKKILRRFRLRHAAAILRFIFQKFMHKPSLKYVNKESDELKIKHDNKSLKDYYKISGTGSVEWAFFQARDVGSFVKYLVSMKEPADYVELIEGLSRIEKENKTSQSYFFSLYLHYLKSKRKMFVYGQKDKAILTLFPGVMISPPWVKKRVENFYECWKPEIMVTGDFTHILSDNPNHHDGLIIARNSDIAVKIKTFVENIIQDKKKHNPLSGLIQKGINWLTKLFG